MLLKLQVLSIFLPSKSTWRMLCESAIRYRPSIIMILYTTINLWWTSDLISTMNNGYVLPALPSSQLSLPSLCICPPFLLSWYVHKSKLSDACGQSLAGSCKKKTVYAIGIMGSRYATCINLIVQQEVVVLLTAELLQNGEFSLPCRLSSIQALGLPMI